MNVVTVVVRVLRTSFFSFPVVFWGFVFLFVCFVLFLVLFL